MVCIHGKQKNVYDISYLSTNNERSCENFTGCFVSFCRTSFTYKMNKKSKYFIYLFIEIFLIFHALFKIFTYNLQRQLPGVPLQSCFEKFHEAYKKRPAIEFFFNKELVLYQIKGFFFFLSCIYFLKLFKVIGKNLPNWSTVSHNKNRLEELPGQTLFYTILQFLMTFFEGFQIVIKILGLCQKKKKTRVIFHTQNKYNFKHKLFLLLKKKKR